VPATTLPEFIAWGRANPGKLNFGTLGEGSGGHLLGETFSLATGIKAAHVPYKGTGAILQALQTGDVHYAFDSVASAQPLVDAGKLRGLAITSDTRFPVVPNVPTMAEAGVKDFEAWLWLGLLAPANTPAEVVNKLNASVNRILRAPDVAARIEKNGFRLAGDTPEQFSRRIQQDITTWSAAVKKARVRLD
jgi:tripartite-type tricarboxylate transporter receptor subunit TctC